MSAVEGRLVALREQVREWGVDFRRLGLALDRDPELIRAHLDLPAVRYLATMGVPPEYGNLPEPVAGTRCYGTRALERAIILEELAFADVGMLVASPGPLLVGVLIDLLADREQKEWFYGRLLAEPLWTFFALAEPDGGTGTGTSGTAANSGTTLTQVGGDVRLSGEKRYVVNACRARLGVVFARVGSGMLGVNAVLVETPTPGFSATPLESIGLRGARIGAITMDDVHVPAARLVGRHLPPAQRGTWASVQTFNLLRPAVAAIALGIARAAHEYVVDHRTTLRRDERDRLDELGRRVTAARALVHLAARAVDARTSDGHLASAAQARACRLAVDATRAACGFFGVGARFDHPLLDKLVRDARGLEVVEGTAKLNLFQGLFTGRLDRDDPFRVGVGSPR
ncbi:acyl-CoA dehydrogenase family protein [Actinosynnema sp. NPDC004786]